MDGTPGPFVLHLGAAENRLHFDVRSEDGAPLKSFTLPGSVFRSLIRDYFLVCESYYDAVKTASPARIEAIDMGRRGLHNEGAELLRDRLFQLGLAARLLISFRVPLTAQEQTYLVLILSIDDPVYR